MRAMKKSNINELPEELKPYMNWYADIELEEGFNKSLEQIDAIDITQLNRIGLKVYEEGKWSVKKIIQHLIDCERIWCYRAILFARQEGTVPDGFDPEIMAEHSNADELPIEKLIAELRMVRLATKAMFESFNREILETNCKFFKYEISVLEIGFAIIGHQLHHFDIIEKRYVPLDK